MRAVRILIGIFLLPCCLAISRTVYGLVLALANGEKTALPVFGAAIGAGLLLWIAVFIYLPAPLKSYVLAHELTHALWGYLMGASLRGMKISSTGGNVRLSESNLLVVLAPYFFPFYTMLVTGAYFLLAVFFDLRPFFPFLLAAMGFTLGFHFCFTVAALSRKQSDLAPYGRFFSYPLIYYLNLFLLGLLLVSVSPLTLERFFAVLAADFRWVWGRLGQGLLAGANCLRGQLP